MRGDGPEWGWESPKPPEPMTDDPTPAMRMLVMVICGSFFGFGFIAGWALTAILR